MNEPLLLTDGARRLLARASDNAKRLGGGSPNAAHIAMSIAKKPPSLAGYILDDLGMDVVLLSNVIELICIQSQNTASSPEIFAAIKEQARLNAERLNDPHGLLGEEHVLLAALQSGEPALREAFDRFGVSIEDAIARAEAILELAYETRSQEQPNARLPGHGGVRRSVGGALALLAWDVAFSGSFGMSFLVCPIWFVVSVLKNALDRPGWRLALVRIAIPAVTLGLVLTNNEMQFQVAETNAARVVTACEEFNTANGRFPESLDELVPEYMPSVPCAKYCYAYGEFWYWNHDNSPMLLWYVLPPHGRKIYDFEKERWSYLD